MPTSDVVLTHEEHKEGYRTVNLEIDLYYKISEIAKKRDISLRKYVNDVIADVIQRDEFVSRIWPFLKIVALDERSMFIKDQKTNHVAEVVIRTQENNQDKFIMQCLPDESDTCVHVAYALGFLASNDLGRLLH
jgi:predicted DNA-binding ribbon-helix-helix protein